MYGRVRESKGNEGGLGAKYVRVGKGMAGQSKLQLKK